MPPSLVASNTANTPAVGENMNAPKATTVNKRSQAITHADVVLWMSHAVGVGFEQAKKLAQGKDCHHDDRFMINCVIDETTCSPELLAAYV